MSAKIKPLTWGGLEIADSYRYLLAPELLAFSIPAVAAIDCSACRKVAEGTALPEIRCCDITPHLPNFLVGEILATGGHPRLTSWLSTRSDPFYLLSPPALVRSHLAARHDGSFGKGCQLLQDGQGRCSLYARRPALCIGYHCYYPDLLWREAFSCLTSTLDLLQNAAARFFVATSDLSLLQIASVWKAADSDDDLWDGETQKPKVRDALWQGWKGREADFYTACYRRLSDGGPTFRLELHRFYREQLLTRLDLRGLLTLQRQAALDSERPDLPLQPSEPSSAIRLLYQKGFIAAEDNLTSLHEQEATLLWYLHALRPTRLWQKLTALFRRS